MIKNYFPPILLMLFLFYGCDSTPDSSEICADFSLAEGDSSLDEEFAIAQALIDLTGDEDLMIIQESMFDSDTTDLRDRLFTSDGLTVEQDLVTEYLQVNSTATQWPDRFSSCLLYTSPSPRDRG